VNPSKAHAELGAPHPSAASAGAGPVDTLPPFDSPRADCGQLSGWSSGCGQSTQGPVRRQVSHGSHGVCHLVRPPARTTNAQIWRGRSGNHGEGSPGRRTLSPTVAQVSTPIAGECPQLGSRGVAIEPAVAACSGRLHKPMASLRPMGTCDANRPLAAPGPPPAAKASSHPGHQSSRRTGCGHRTLTRPQASSPCRVTCSPPVSVGATNSDRPGVTDSSSLGPPSRPRAHPTPDVGCQSTSEPGGNSDHYQSVGRGGRPSGEGRRHWGCWTATPSTRRSPTSKEGTDNHGPPGRIQL
jgi:hypothetical protein